LSKPDPFLLEAVALEFSEDLSGCYAVGELSGGVDAARRSRNGFRPAGLLPAAPEREASKVFRLTIEVVDLQSIDSIQERS